MSLEGTGQQDGQKAGTGQQDSRPTMRKVAKELDLAPMVTIDAQSTKGTAVLGGLCRSAVVWSREGDDGGELGRAAGGAWVAEPCRRRRDKQRLQRAQEPPADAPSVRAVNAATQAQQALARSACVAPNQASRRPGCLWQLLLSAASACLRRGDRRRAQFCSRLSAPPCAHLPPAVSDVDCLEPRALPPGLCHVLVLPPAKTPVLPPART